MSERRGADLHVHTTHSDGRFTPGEVVRAAFAARLAALAITDHDTVSALESGRVEAERLGIELIAGVELTCERAGIELHVLGYLFDSDDHEITCALRDAKAAREQRIVEIAGRLRALGLSVDLAKIRQNWPRATLGRRHVAEWLVLTRQATSYREVFDRWLGDGGVGCVPKPRIAWDVAIRLVNDAGGVAALAHPPRSLRDADLREMIEGGLSGIEVQWPRVGQAAIEQGRARADRLGLVPLAGSDFHAADRPGARVGSITTSWANLERLRSLSRAAVGSST